MEVPIHHPKLEDALQGGNMRDALRLENHRLSAIRHLAASYASMIALTRS